MTQNATTFHVVAGTNITAKIVAGYAEALMPLYNQLGKTDRNHKRKVQRLYESAKDVITATNFLLKHPGISELSDQEARSIETVLFLASDLDIEKRALVIKYIEELNGVQS